jgi:hypothetical protein
MPWGFVPLRFVSASDMATQLAAISTIDESTII